MRSPVGCGERRHSRGRWASRSRSRVKVDDRDDQGEHEYRRISSAPSASSGCPGKRLWGDQGTLRADGAGGTDANAATIGRSVSTMRQIIARRLYNRSVCRSAAVSTECSFAIDLHLCARVIPNNTRSPALTFIGISLPASSRPLRPTAMISPCCGFSLAVSGMMMPPAVFSSASIRLTTTRRGADETSWISS
jgi:hypothetical protein